MFASIKRAFRKLDTAELDASIEAANAQHRRTRACARALRMDVSCGDGGQVVRRIATRMGNTLGRTLRELNQPVTEEDAEMQALLRRM